MAEEDTQRALGVLEGKVEGLVDSQQRMEDRLSNDMSKIFDKMDEHKDQIRGMISDGNGRVHTRIDVLEKKEEEFRTTILSKVEAISSTHSEMKTSNLQQSSALSGGIALLVSALGAWIASKLHLGGGQ